jgi:putrescine transport system permease protein
MTRLGTTPEIYALATVIVAVVAIVLLAVAVASRRRGGRARVVMASP